MIVEEKLRLLALADRFEADGKLGVYTLIKYEHAEIAAALRAAPARCDAQNDGLRQALGVVKSAYYSEPAGSQENAWNDACQHIEEGVTALIVPSADRKGEA